MSAPSSPAASTPLALIVGVPGPEFSPAELAFFRDANPYGLFLARRNMRTPDQTRALAQAFRAAVGRADAPVLTDQEGGRVSHLDSGAWPRFRPFADFARLAARDLDRARQALSASSRAMGRMMVDCGLTSGCSPVLDLAVAGADPVIGPRSLGGDPEQVAILGRVVVDGFLAAGLLPIMKHIPGHGRATEDSHKTRPVVTASVEELLATDARPFMALRDTPWAMVAHVVYRAIDPERPASVSPQVIEGFIRGAMAYDGVLVSDCVFMNALTGTLGQRVADVLAAGCDLALHTHGALAETEAAAAHARPLSDASMRRLAAASARLGDGSQVPSPAIAELHAEAERLLA